MLSSPLASARHEQVGYYCAAAGMLPRHLLRPVVLLDLEPSFPAMPKGKDDERERGLELEVQEHSCPNAPLQGQCKVKSGKDPVPNHQRSSQQHSHCSCTSSRLKPDTNGFPGSRTQPEAVGSPEATACVTFSGICYTHTINLCCEQLPMTNCNP